MLKRIHRGLKLFESGLLMALLAVMVGVAVFQIVARNFFGTGLAWGGGLVQIAVLWMTMVGAAVAAGEDSHIRIDLVARLALPRFRAIADRLTALFTAVLCGALGWYSIEFIRWDFMDGVVAFGSVPAWICESIIPLASGVMALRYLIRAIWPLDAGE